MLIKVLIRIYNNKKSVSQGQHFSLLKSIIEILNLELI